MTWSYPKHVTQLVWYSQKWNDLKPPAGLYDEFLSLWRTVLPFVKLCQIIFHMARPTPSATSAVSLLLLPSPQHLNHGRIVWFCRLKYVKTCAGMYNHVQYMFYLMDSEIYPNISLFVSASCQLWPQHQTQRSWLVLSTPGCKGRVGHGEWNQNQLLTLPQFRTGCPKCCLHCLHCLQLPQNPGWSGKSWKLTLNAHLGMAQNDWP